MDRLGHAVSFPHPMKRSYGVSVARKLKAKLVAQGVPVKKVYLFGSVAKEKTHPGSDIDIAIVCEPFAATRHDENMALRRARRNIDRRVEPVCLHPVDFDNKYFTLAQEVRRHGIAV